MRVSILAFAALSLLFACSKNKGETEESERAAKWGESSATGGTREQHLRVCHHGLPETLDPVRAGSTVAQPIVTELFDGLAAWDERGVPVPSLAERWESEKGARVWTFHLREGAVWSNGRPVVAEDFVFHIARLLNPASGSVGSGNLFGVRGARAYYEALEKSKSKSKGKGKGQPDPGAYTLPPSVGVRAPNPRTLVLEFDKPAPWAPYLAASHFMRPAPRELVTAQQGAWTSPEDLISSGPFHLSDVASDRIVLEKSTSFWDRENVKLDRVTFLAVTDQSRSLEKFQGGACDVTSSGNVPPDARGVEGLERHPYLGVYFYIFNVERLPSRHLRRALALAVDRSKLSVHGAPATAITPAMPPAMWDGQTGEPPCTEAGAERVLVTSPGAPCYAPPPGLGFDPKAAAGELELAQKELGDAFPESLTISFNEGEKHRRLAGELARQWREWLGLKVTLREQEWRRFLMDTQQGDYDIARMGWIGSIPDPLEEFVGIFRCDSLLDRTNWCHEEFDRLVAQGLNEEDPKGRLALARRAEALLLAEAPIVPLYVYGSRRLRRERVRGLHPNFLTKAPLRRVRLEPGAERGQVPAHQ